MSFKDDSLIGLVIDQINYDQEMGQQDALYDFLDHIGREQMIDYLSQTQDALYDFLDHIGREQMIDYLSQTRLDFAMEQGVIDESEYMMRKWGDES